MARVSKKAPTDRGPAEAAIAALDSLALQVGQRIRFRKADGGRWLEGVAAGREPDGSLGLHDARGRRRSIPVTHVEVQIRGPRGGKVWEPLVEHAAREVQLGMFES